MGVLKEFLGLSRVLKGCFKQVSRMFHETFKEDEFLRIF